jgi:hypothetical protein
MRECGSVLFIGFSLILGMSLSGAFLAIFAKELRVPRRGTNDK